MASTDAKGRDRAHAIVEAFTEEEVDMLAEKEHERFNAERLQRQWRMGARDPAMRMSPFLIPWRDLEGRWREVDRVLVEAIPRILGDVGYKIYRLGSGGE